MRTGSPGSLLDSRDSQSPSPGNDAQPSSAHLTPVPAVQPAAASTSAAGGTSHKATNQVWRVRCGDVINRDRCLTVLVEEGDVVLVGPPGETARLSAGQLGELRAALNEAWELSKSSAGNTEGRR